MALEGTGVNYGRGDDANAPIGAPGTEYTLDAEREDEGTFFANDGDNNSSSSSKNTSMKAFLMESPNDLSEITSDAVAHCVSFCPSVTTKLRGRASEMLITYIRSMGKYGPETPQAGLIPLYGSGEVAQAFCRVAAVSGVITALRQPIKKIERKNSESHIEVLTKGGRVLTCKKLVLGDAQGDIEMVGFANDEIITPNRRESSKFCINRAVLVTNRSMVGSDEAQHRVFVAIPPAARPGKIVQRRGRIRLLRDAARLLVQMLSERHVHRSSLPKVATNGTASRCFCRYPRQHFFQGETKRRRNEETNHFVGHLVPSA